MRGVDCAALIDGMHVTSHGMPHPTHPMAQAYWSFVETSFERMVSGERAGGTTLRHHAQGSPRIPKDPRSVASKRGSPYSQ